MNPSFERTPLAQTIHKIGELWEHDRQRARRLETLVRRIHRTLGCAVDDCGVESHSRMGLGEVG
mgnify:FL=1